MPQVIISFWSKELGTDLEETPLPLYGSGPEAQENLRNLWKFAPRKVAINLTQFDYSYRWYRRGDDVIVQMGTDIQE